MSATRRSASVSLVACVLASLATLLLPSRGGAQEELANVVFLPKEGTDIVTLRIMFIAGSSSDPKGKEGITALTARLMAEGGTRALSAAELRTALFPMAATLDVQTDKELTVFEGRVHRNHLQKFMRIFCDVLVEPRFDPKEFERLRRNAIENIERRIRSSDDELLGKLALEALLYEGHPYGHYVGGTVAALKALKLEDLQAHARAVFTADRMILGLAGKVDMGLARLMKIRLAQLPKTGAKVPDVPPPKPSKVRVLIVEKPTKSVAISMGYPYELRRGMGEFFPMMVGVSAFGEHRQVGGRLFDAIRGKRGLNYGDYAYVEAHEEAPGTTYPQPNVPRRLQQFSVWIRPVEPQYAVFATRAALYETEKLLKGGLSEEEVQRQKGFLEGYTRLWEATDSRRLGYAMDDIFYRTPNHLAAFRASLPRTTASQVNAALRKYVRPGQFRYVFVTANGQALKEALLSGKPSPITYPTPKPKDVLQEDKQIEVFPLRFAPDEIRVVKAEEMFAR